MSLVRRQTRQQGYVLEIVYVGLHAARTRVILVFATANAKTAPMCGRTMPGAESRVRQQSDERTRSRILEGLS